MNSLGGLTVKEFPFDALFNAAPTPCLVISAPDWIIVAANDARLRVTDTKREDQIGRKLFDVFPDDPKDPDADGVRNLTSSLERVMATGTTDVMKLQRYCVRDPSGEFAERWWTPINTPVLNESREVLFILHQVEEVADIVTLKGEAPANKEMARYQQSIIDRLRASDADFRASEERLRASEELSRRILASSADCIKVLDLDARLEFMSEGGMCVMEVDDFSAVKGVPWPDFWTGDGRVLALSAVEQAKAGRTARFQGFATTMKGTPRWWDVIVTPISGPSGRPDKLLSVSRDVTAAKKAEAALRESEEQLRLATDAAEIALWDLDLVTGTLFWPARLKAMFGISAHLPIGIDDFHQGLHPDDAERSTAAFENAVDPEKRALYDVEYRTIGRNDGLVRWIAAKGRGQFDDQGRCVRVIGTAIDITGRKRTDDQLRELNATLEAKVAARTAERDRTWNNSRDLLIILGTDGMIRAVNPAWTTILGWSAEELVGRPYLDFVYPDDRPATKGAHNIVSPDALPIFDNRYWHKDGSHRWISWVAAPDGSLIYASGRDVTDERARDAQLNAAQEALRQSQKMEAMGQLTGGVAHDFNNLLTPIMGSLDMLSRKKLGGERDQRLIDGALQSAERAKTLVQRLLSFARRQPLQATAVDVAKLITNMADLVASTAGPQIKVMVDIAPDLPAAHADANQLEMALLNLAVNARDAMPDGGALRISARRDFVKRGRPDSLKEGDYIRLTVADTGSGMDKDTLTRAVEPFFSTKGVGRGTGLGLSSAHGLASQLGGALTVQSRPGVGTDVDIWLPVSEQAAKAAAAPPDARQETRIQGRALLVDDEEFVRISTASMLSDLGFDVFEASSGEEALTILRGGQLVDLLVTDHLMPGMTGTELACIVRAERPEVQILIISGYAERQGLDPDVARLSKPFRNDELALSLANMSNAGS